MAGSLSCRVVWAWVIPGAVSPVLTPVLSGRAGRCQASAARRWWSLVMRSAQGHRFGRRSVLESTDAVFGASTQSVADLQIGDAAPDGIGGEHGDAPAVLLSPWRRPQPPGSGWLRSSTRRFAPTWNGPRRSSTSGHDPRNPPTARPSCARCSKQIGSTRADAVSAVPVVRASIDRITLGAHRSHPRPGRLRGVSKSPAHDAPPKFVGTVRLFERSWRDRLSRNPMPRCATTCSRRGRISYPDVQHPGTTARNPRSKDGRSCPARSTPWPPARPPRSRATELPDGHALRMVGHVCDNLMLGVENTLRPDE